MRSERRKEIIAQMEANKQAKRRKGGNAFCRLLSIIYTLLAAAFVGLLAYMDVLPEKYFWPAVIGLAVASDFIVPVMFSKNGKTGRKIGATLVAIVLIGVFGVGTWYLVDTVAFLGEITAPKEVTEDYHVVVKRSRACKSCKASGPPISISPTTSGLALAITSATACRDFSGLMRFV